MSMGRRIRVGVALGAFGVLAGVWTGCTSKKQTELVAGVSTQVRVPKDLKAIRIDAQSGGINVFCGVYDVTNGIARLPKTLALQAVRDPKLPVTITVTGFPITSTDNGAPTALTSCVSSGLPQVKVPGAKAPSSDDPNPPVARVLRASRQPYVQDKVMFLPMPLRFSCFERDCTQGPNGGPEKTCKAGKCVDPDTDETTLVEYQDAFIFGNSNTCFSPGRCLPDAVPPVLIDAATCTYALANTPSAGDAGINPLTPTNGNGMNVRAYYDDGTVTEVLDLDKDEGFFIPDPSKPQQFQLAEGLCHPDTDTPHKIVALTTSGLCPSKTALQPVCDDESASRIGDDAGGPTPIEGQGLSCNPVEIQQASSALIVLMDRSDGMKDFYSKETAQKVLALSLSDPAFRNTVLGMEFFPRKGTDSTTSCDPALQFKSFASTDIPLGESRKTQKTIADAVKATTGMTAPLNARSQIDEALDATTGAYAALSEFAARGDAFNRLAVLIVGATDYGVNQCDGAANISTLSAKVGAVAPGIKTFVVNLPNSSNNSATPNAGGAASESLAISGKTLRSFNTVTNELAGAEAFQTVLADLASCAYEAPGKTCAIDPNTNALKCGVGSTIDKTLSVSYLDPTTLQRRTVSPNGESAQGCTGKTSGWTLDDKKRIQICGQDCESLRSSLKTSSDFALAFGRTAPAIPLYLTNCGAAVTGGPSPSPRPVVDAGTTMDASSPPADAGTPKDASDGG